MTEPATRPRLPPVSPTTRELYLYSGNRCAFRTQTEDCNKLLLRKDGTWNCQVAHIHGVKEDAARGAHSLDPDELRDPSNLVLMCSEHHLVIDNKELESTYTVSLVQKMKADHEAPYREAMSGLERIVDVSDGISPNYPLNLGKIVGMDDEEVLNGSLADMKSFIDNLKRQPPAIRDLITLVLIHGDLQRRFGNGFREGVGASVPKIEGVASVSVNEVHRRARHLEDAGLLSIVEDEGLCFLALTDPVAQETGWDIFAELKVLTLDAPDLAKRAILDLDFTVFDR